MGLDQLAACPLALLGRARVLIPHPHLDFCSGCSLRTKATTLSEFIITQTSVSSSEKYPGKQYPTLCPPNPGSLLPSLLGQACFLTSPHIHTSLGSLGGLACIRNTDMGDIPIPDRPVNWSPPPQASLVYERTSSLIPLGSSTAPLPPFASSQSQLFLFYSTSHSFTVFFNFAFLCSIYWELALIYIKPGCADPQTSLFLYFCIVNSSHSFPPPPHIPI